MIFMDNMMPNMDGCAATKRLRENGYKGRIVGLTGDAMTEDVSTFLACGADAVIVKPLRLNVLDDILGYLKENGFSHQHPINDESTTMQDFVKNIGK